MFINLQSPKALLLVSILLSCTACSPSGTQVDEISDVTSVDSVTTLVIDDAAAPVIREAATPVIGEAAALIDEASAIRAALAQSQPSMQISDIKPSPVAGLYEVSLQNDQVLYASADAKFFIPGDLYALMPEGLVNLGEQKRNDSRAAKIAAIDESEMIIYDVEGERKATLTVFTDVDCPYCRKLHAEVPELNSMGIAVRYLAFPRTGLDTETYFKMVSTWCSENRLAMFTSVTRGGSIAPGECANPIASHYSLGREVGVTGTPALVLEDGTILPGYVPAITLAGYLLGEL